MKTNLLLIGALLTPALACESHDFRTGSEHRRTTTVAALQASKPAKQPAPKTPPAPAPTPDGKERKPRPAPPAHLFM